MTRTTRFASVIALCIMVSTGAAPAFAEMEAGRAVGERWGVFEFIANGPDTADAYVSVRFGDGTHLF